MGRAQLDIVYEHIISLENLLEAWREFVRGKRGRSDVQQFELRLMKNILSLHNDLAARTYRHGPYEHFKISDPKPRDIHKANVRDRLLHHAIYRVLYPFFDRTFIATSYSCRKEKGGLKAINHFRSLSAKVSRNDTCTVWVLKCDIRKFFASIDHQYLKQVLARYIIDQDTLALLSEIIGSFSYTREGVGLPLGNLTSQLLVNIYMNEFDQFVKHKMKVRNYIRYADDFMFLSNDRQWLEGALCRVGRFLSDELRLTLHPDKVSICTLASGIDFLGWIHFPKYRVLRTSAKHRMLKALQGEPSDETLASYRGLLTHGNSRKLAELIPTRARELHRL